MISTRAASHAIILLIFSSGALLLSLLWSCSTVPIHDATQADALMAGGNYAGAIQEYTRSINLDPNQPEPYLGRGYAYEKMRNYEKALEDFSSYIKLRPQDPQGYLIRGLLLDTLGKNILALTDYDTVIRLDPANATAYSYRGSLFERQGNSQAAIADFRTAARMGQKEAQNKLNSMGVVW